jgi:uncharacterized protein YoxC
MAGEAQASLSGQGSAQGSDHLRAGSCFGLTGERPPTDLEPRRGWAADAVGYLPRLVLGAFDDLRSIAASARVLPEVARSLGVIEASVESMDREVKLMRQAVERVDEDVIGVIDAVDPLDQKLEEVRRTLRPVSRVTARISRRRPEIVEERPPDQES